jgi:hypothetical protein
MPSFFDKWMPPREDAERARLQAFVHRLFTHCRDRKLAAEDIPALDRPTSELRKFVAAWTDHACRRFGIPADTSPERVLVIVFYEKFPVALPGTPRRNPSSLFEHVCLN